MNKVVAILGFIVLITLGALFFCIGFFTGTTIQPNGAQDSLNQNEGSKIVSQNRIDDALRPSSSSISKKVFKILAGATDSQDANQNRKMSGDSLLKEIISSHTEDDDCSVDKTTQNIMYPTVPDEKSFQGKKVVFIGYFKNSVALQIQKLLMTKGYKVHVEPSKTTIGESFVFCGPFKKGENAQKLANWFQQNNFAEAKVVNVVNEEVEETLYDSFNEESIPANVERDIPEIDEQQLNQLRAAQTANQGFKPLTPRDTAGTLPTVPMEVTTAIPSPGAVSPQSVPALENGPTSPNATPQLNLPSL
ncbi:MAG: hypothetical protein IJA14_01125 [Alphaproteobacteria bacterium]|nr:hypothetical protein [Alphaproteobacteria bacterium]